MKGPERGELGLPRLLARFPHHPCPGRVQQFLAPFLQLTRAQRFALLVDPPAQREESDSEFDFRVVRDGVQAGDLVLFAPAQQGLVALQPHQRLRPVHPGAQESGDRRRVPGGGEVQQRRLHRGLGVVLLLVLAVTVGPDDPAFFIALHVDLAGVVAAGQGAGGELLNEAFVVRAQALEHGHERLEAGGGDHVGRVLAALQENGHDDPGDLGRAVRVRAERPADVLHDLHLGAAGDGLRGSVG